MAERGAAASATPALPALPTKNALFLGDSITQGLAGNVNDCNYAYPRRIAEALGARCGVVAYGGTSWIVAGPNNIPTLEGATAAKQILAMVLAEQLALIGRLVQSSA